MAFVARFFQGKSDASGAGPAAEWGALYKSEFYEPAGAALGKVGQAQGQISSQKQLHEALGKALMGTHAEFVKRGYEPKAGETLEDNLLQQMAISLTDLFEEKKPMLRGSPVPRKFTEIQKVYQKLLKEFKPPVTQPPPGLAQSPGRPAQGGPERYAIGTPGRLGANGQGVVTEVSEWAQQQGLGELGTVLTDLGVKTLQQLRTVHGGDVDELFGDGGAFAGLGLGVKSEFRVALQGLGGAMASESGRNQGPTGAPLGPLNPLGAGPPQMVQPRPGAQQDAVPNPLGSADPQAGFRDAGPLQMLADGARRIMGDLSASQQGQEQGQQGWDQHEARAPPGVPQGQMPTGWQPQNQQPLQYSPPGQMPVGWQPAPWMNAAPTQMMPPGPSVTAGGRLVLAPPPRAAVTPVPLRVPSAQGPAIYEEWTDSGRQSLAAAVVARPWKTQANKDVAFNTAREMDVWISSGVQVWLEPGGEVSLRNLAATWLLDQHPKQAAVSDAIRESAISTWGLPRGLLEEARTVNKLLSQGGFARD